MFFAGLHVGEFLGVSIYIERNLSNTLKRVFILTIQTQYDLSALRGRIFFCINANIFIYIFSNRSISLGQVVGFTPSNQSKTPFRPTQHNEGPTKPVGSWYMGYPSKTHITLKYREISFRRNLFGHCQTLEIFHRTQQHHCRALCKVPKRFENEMGVMANTIFEKFGIKMSFGGIFLLQYLYYNGIKNKAAFMDNWSSSNYRSISQTTSHWIGICLIDFVIISYIAFIPHHSFCIYWADTGFSYHYDKFRNFMDVWTFSPVQSMGWNQPQKQT